MDVENDSSGNPVISTGLPAIADPIICTSLDLDLYISRYNGNTKLQRLTFIAERCPNLQEATYRKLLLEIRKGSNTALYMKIHDIVGSSLVRDASLDFEWVDNTERRELMKLERLEAELMTAKATMVKESIRLSYNDIGDFHYERGNLSEAMKSFCRTRDYCATPQHHMDMWVKLINISMDLAQLGNVNFYITKADGVAGEVAITAKFKAAGALLLLIEGQYKSAARKFLDVGVCLGGSYSTLITTEDVVVYGVLCALATLDRSEIRQKVLENSVFKSFLGLVPDMKAFVNDFFAGKYGDCLAYLDRIRSELLLDIHLSKHANFLISQITERMILQFCLPYSSLDLNKMAVTLKMSIVEVEKKVALLISTGKLSARIDSQSKTLFRRQQDVRSLTIEKVERLSSRHLTDVKRGILRLSVIQHGLYVPTRDSSSSPRGGNSSGGFSSAAHSSSSYKTESARKDTSSSQGVMDFSSVMSDDSIAARGLRMGMGGVASLAQTFGLSREASRSGGSMSASSAMHADLEGEGEDDNEDED